MSATTVTIPLDLFVNILLGTHKHDECSNPLWQHAQKQDWISLKAPISKELKALLPPVTEFSQYYVQEDKHGNAVLWEHRHWRDSNCRRLLQIEARQVALALDESKTSNPRRIARIARAIGVGFNGVFKISQVEATLMQAWASAGEEFLKNTVSIYEKFSSPPQTFYEPPIDNNKDKENDTQQTVPSTAATGSSHASSALANPAPETVRPAHEVGPVAGLSNPLAGLL